MLRFLLVPALVLALLTPLSSAGAHPGSGIVVDRSGNVYFVVAGSNVVMRLTRDGRVSAFVTDERLRLPHHLVLGRAGTLYVASDYDGKVWRVGSDGSLAEHFNSNRATRARGEPELYVGFGGDPFTVDSAGNVYALASAVGSTIVRVTPEGKVTRIAANAKFGDLHFSSMTWGADGALYLTDANRVWRIVGDSATAIVPRGLALSRATGIAVDPAGNIYVADYAARRVVRLARDGSVNTPRAIERLRLRNPTGVTLADGALYVLDNPVGGVAVLRVVGDKVDRLYTRRDARIYLWSALLTMVPLIFALQTLQRRSRSRLDWFVWTTVAGVVIIGIYWVARDAYIFTVLRHVVLALYLWGAWKSYPRATSGNAPIAAP